MARSSFFQASALVSTLVSLAAAQTPTTSANDGFSTTLNGTPTFFRSVFTIPASADVGPDLISNIKDPQAVNAQDVCPGYKASDLKENDRGLTATLSLAGKACNLYGTDVEELDLTVEYQAKGRLAVNIVPKYLVSTLQYFRNISLNITGCIESVSVDPS